MAWAVAHCSASSAATAWKLQARPSCKRQPPRTLAIARAGPASNVQQQKEQGPGWATRRMSASGSTERKKAPTKPQEGHKEDQHDEQAAGGELALPPHVDAISSPGNPFVKQAVKLRQSSSYRRATGKVMVVGATPLLEIGCASPRQPAIDILLLIPGASNEAEEKELQAHASRTVWVSPAVMRKLAGVESPEAVTAVAVLPLPMQELQQLLNGQQQRQPRRVLALDGVQDPGNLGSLLRSAAAFGWDAVLLLPGCCDPFNDKALRAARGGVFRLPLAAIASWPQLLEFAGEAGLELLAADPAPDGMSPESVRRLEALCLVLGSEGRGLSEQASSACQRVAIPMPGDFESLNVAVAGGILMYLLNPGGPRS